MDEREWGRVFSFDASGGLKMKEVNKLLDEEVRPSARRSMGDGKVVEIRGLMRGHGKPALLAWYTNRVILSMKEDLVDEPILMDGCGNFYCGRITT